MNDLLHNQKGTTATPVDCLGQTFSSDEDRREHFLKLLAEKLKDLISVRSKGFPSARMKPSSRYPIHRTTPPPRIPSLKISSSITASRMTRTLRTAKNRLRQM